MHGNSLLPSTFIIDKGTEIHMKIDTVYQYLDRILEVRPLYSLYSCNYARFSGVEVHTDTK